jgi:hypothetical protein
MKPPFANSTYKPQSAIPRSLGNAQSRTSAIPAAPAYGNTTNVNGAQTAVGGMSAVTPTMPTAASPSVPSASPVPSAAYPGGNVPGIASYYRNSALNSYQTPQSPLTPSSAPVDPSKQPTAGQIYAMQIPTDQAGMSNRLANQNPQYAGMQQRLASQLPGLQADQAAVADGRAVNMGGYSEGQTVRFNKTPGMAESSALAQRGRENSEVRAKYDDPNLIARRNAFSAEKKERHQAFKDANGGLNYKQMDRLEDSRRAIERNVKAGRISRSEANERMEGLASRAMSRANPSSSARPADAPDRVRLPDGQLPQATREKAATTAKNLTNPTYQGPSVEFNQSAEVVRSIGLTNDMSAGEAMNRIKASPFPLEDPEAAKRTAMAYKRYWGSKRDADKDWTNVAATNLYGDDKQFLAMMNELAETPDDEVDKWIAKYSGHLAARGAKPEPQDNPGYGFGSF